VISGFLITSILFREIEDEDFSVLRFYARRVRRILPALFVMLLVVAGLGYILQFPGDLVATSDSARYAAVGASNFYFYWHTGYFDQSAGVMPLLHTWSLGVEEQFYAAWPGALAIVAALTRRRRTAIAMAICALVVASFVASLKLLGSDPKGAFYFPYTRAWELGLGGLLVFIPRLPRHLSEAANIVGLAMLAIGIATISVDPPFPGWSALEPCVGAALIIWPKEDTWLAAALGALRSVGTGRKAQLMPLAAACRVSIA
jgi:peptidoglycan/LPS O-acetylase OafA/YrhL